MTFPMGRREFIAGFVCMTAGAIAISGPYPVACFRQSISKVGVKPEPKPGFGGKSVFTVLGGRTRWEPLLNHH